MQSVKDIKNRIRSVSETAKITRAMELISAAKMQKASSRYNASLAYFNRVRSVIRTIACGADMDDAHPYLAENRGGKRAYLVIGSDKGMSGDYNHSIEEFADKTITDPSDSMIFCIGSIVYKYFQSKGIPCELTECSADGTLDDARRISTYLVELYKSEKIREVNIIYTRLVTKARQECSMLKLLPILKKDFGDDIPETKAKFEPDEKTVFDVLVPQYLLGILFGCITAGKYTENLERMRAMNSATESANELLAELQINYNKARQEKITTELTELSASLLDIN